MATERIHGPYKHGKRWRVYEVGGDGLREMVSFPSEAEATAYIQAARRVAVGRTVGQAVSEYLAHLGAEVVRGHYRRESTVRLAGWRLTAFLRLHESDRMLTALTRAVAEKLVAQRAAEVRPDTLAGELALASRWARWERERGTIKANPFEGLVAPGERSEGKPQLRVDSARAFLRVALGEGSASGLAAAMALTMGMRASEITNLQARDVDDGGRTLWITRSKTRKGVRRLDVHHALRERLRVLAAGKAPDERIWGDVDRHWLGYHVPRLCELAGVDRVTPHGLRGTFATLSVAALPTEHVATVLGHESPEVTRSAYIAPGAEQSAAARRLETLLENQLPGATPGPGIVS